MGTSWVAFDGKDCSGCKHLNERGYCEFTACIIPCTVRATIPDVKPQTNADRIRGMSDEELATWLTACLWGEARDVPFLLSCTVDKWLDWLKETEDENRRT